MSIQIIGSSGAVLDTDSSKQVFITKGLPSHDDGGYFTLYGAPTGECASDIAADVTLAYMYYLGTGDSVCCLKKFSLSLTCAERAFPDPVAGIIGLQRFQYLGLYPTSIPIPNRQSVDSIKSNMLSATSNAAITMTGAMFGREVAWTRVPATITIFDPMFTWIYKPTYPTVLYPYDGLALRTRTIMPSFLKFIYSFTADFFEKLGEVDGN